VHNDILIRLHGTTVRVSESGGGFSFEGILEDVGDNWRVSHLTRSGNGTISVTFDKVDSIIIGKSGNVSITI